MLAAEDLLGPRFPAFAPAGHEPGTGAAPVRFVAVFVLTMSAVSAVTCAIVRGPSWLVFAKAFLLLMAVISAVTLTLTHVERHSRSYAGVLIAALAVLFLPCLVVPLGRAGELLIDPVLIALAMLGIRQLFVPARAMLLRQNLPAASLGVLAGLGYFLVINARGLATVLLPEQAVLGVQNLDTLFHAAVANMIVNYGAVSVGMDGLVPIVYHFLSHIWLGCLGEWFGSGTFQAYFIAAQVVAVPLLFFSLFLAIYLLRPPGERLRSGALLVLVPLFLLYCTEMWNVASYLISESYFLAVIIFLLGLPLLGEITRTTDCRKLCLQAVCAVVAGALMEISKVSVGVAYLPAAGFLLLRQFGLSARAFLGLGAVSLALAATAGWIVFRAMGGSLVIVDPFNFVREYPEAAWPCLVANVVLLCAALVVSIVGARPDRLSAQAFAIMAVAASVPSLLLVISGGSAYYFIHVGTVAATVFVAAYAASWLEQKVPNLFRPEVLIAALVLVVLDTPQKITSPVAVGEQWAELARRTGGNLGNATEVGASTWQRLGTLLLPGGARRRSLAGEMSRVARAQSLRTLLDAGVTDATRSAVFVPPDNAPFWTNLQDCRAGSLIIPAMLGVPMIKGLSPVALECRNEPNYGFPAYGPASVSEPASDAELCADTTKWRLRTVFVLAKPTEVRRIDCPR